MPKTIEHAELMQLAPAEFGDDLVLFHEMDANGRPTLRPVDNSPVAGGHIAFSKAMVNPLFHNLFTVAPLLYQDMAKIGPYVTAHMQYIDMAFAAKKLDPQIHANLRKMLEQVEMMSTGATSVALEGIAPMIERYRKENKK